MPNGDRGGKDQGLFGLLSLGRQVQAEVVQEDGLMVRGF